MFYRSKSNQYINEGTPFEIDGVQYPANWLNLSTSEEKTSIGLVEVTTSGAPKNDKYYWVTEKLNGPVRVITNTPKDLDECKVLAVSNVDATAYSLLLPSDWMVVKSTETGTPVAAEWTTYRGDVRTAANESRVAIETCVDVDELAALVITWPVSPDAPIVNTI